MQLEAVDKDTPIDTLQELFHQSLGWWCLEVGRVHTVGTRQQTGTINISHVVGDIGRIVEAGPAEPTLSEVLESGRNPEHRVEPRVRAR